MPHDFDPDGPAADGLFGLPHTPQEAQVHVLQIPFDATTSYRKGAGLAPAAVLAASAQVDLYDVATGRPYEAGICLLPADPAVLELGAEATELVDALRSGGAPSAGERVDAIGDELNARTHARAAASLDEGKLVALLGGDHSVPFGAIEACAERHPGMGILHVDAHADLRRAYEGFRWSHASILYNVTERIGGVARLLQVGLRDLCEEETRRIQASEGRIQVVYDHDWARARLEGRSLPELVREAIACLPEAVYVTFDVDGLDPSLCPSTGTPVPGGLRWDEAMLWLEELSRSGRRVVGLDLCEVSPGPEGDPEGLGWDAAVGARLLYRLIGYALRSAESL